MEVTSWLLGLLGCGSWNGRGYPDPIGRQKKKRNQWSGCRSLRGPDNSEKVRKTLLLLGVTAHVFLLSCTRTASITLSDYAQLLRLPDQVQVLLGLYYWL